MISVPTMQTRTVLIALVLASSALLARQPAGRMHAKTPSSRTEVTFAQRQRELSSLLESLAPPSSPSVLLLYPQQRLSPKTALPATSFCSYLMGSGR